MTNNRIIAVTGGLNFRELGGYPTIDGHTVKWHKLIRTAGLADLTPADQQHLTDYGVVADVDFRSKDEQLQSPDKVPTGVNYHFSPSSLPMTRRMPPLHRNNWKNASQLMTNPATITCWTSTGK